jgi:glycosyltransferase involved in cell wall biosynthesis
MHSIVVLIPAFNEEKAIGKVLQALPKNSIEAVVIDNGSTDQTAEVARVNGATVLHESKKGYGHACLKGMAYIKAKASKPSTPIENGTAVFTLGARVKALREPGALMPQQLLGNQLACFLMRVLYRSRFTDLGPFRAIDWEVLQSLEMQDKTYGWTVEMQLKVLKRKLPYLEIPVKYRNRIGTSKVSGTVKGSLLAGYKILGWIGSFYFSRWR